MLTDSHCHLASHRYDPGEVQDILARAREAGVLRFVSLSTCLEDLDANLQLSSQPGVHCCIGIHPCDVHQAPDDAVSRLASHTDHPGVCGIGETGLDYYHPAPDGWDEQAFRMRQQEFLRQHFQLAAASGLNLVIHTRDRNDHASFEDALAIYREFHSSVRAVFHCFVGPWDNARRVIELGGLLSFGGVATFKNADAVRDCARQCPAGTFMLETDSPYLAPTPHRGQRNEPAYVRHCAEAIAATRQESIESLAEHTNATAAEFFRFRQTEN